MMKALSRLREQITLLSLGTLYPPRTRRFNRHLQSSSVLKTHTICSAVFFSLQKTNYRHSCKIISPTTTSTNLWRWDLKETRSTIRSSRTSHTQRVSISWDRTWPAQWGMEVPHVSRDVLAPLIWCIGLSMLIQRMLRLSEMSSSKIKVRRRLPVSLIATTLTIVILGWRMSSRSTWGRH